MCFFVKYFDLSLFRLYNCNNMENNIRDIIAQNLIRLRKKNNLTQNDLAEKINYSDNAVSRWEHGEVTPSIETLEQISKVFNVPLRSLIEDDAVKTAEINDKTKMINRLAWILISVTLVWLTATIVFVCSQLIYHYTFWQIFVWSIPIVSLIMLPFHRYWGRHVYKFVLLSIFVWTLLAAIFVQFYIYTIWLWLIFTIGVPIQIALAIWAFIKPKPKAPKKQKKIKNKKTTNTDSETNLDENK